MKNSQHPSAGRHARLKAADTRESAAGINPLGDPQAGASPMTVDMPVASALTYTWLHRLSIVAVAVMVAVAIASTYLVGARSGVAWVGAGCVVAALVRLIAPDGAVPSARSKLFDVAVLAGLAFVVFLFLPYAGPGLDRPLQLP